MALQVAYSNNVSRTPQTLDTQEFNVPTDLGVYRDIRMFVTMPDKAASDPNLKLVIRYQTYDEVNKVWETGDGIEWVGGVINQKTGEYIRPSLVDSLDRFKGKRVKVTISVPKTASIGFKIELI